MNQNVGVKPEIKRLYNHSTGDNALWSDFDDPVKEEQRLQALSLRSALIQKFGKRKQGEKELPGWETKTIEIQSTRLKSLLETIFTGYPNWNSGSTPWTFTPPFKDFFHVWDKIQDESTSKQKDYNTRIEVTLLRDAMKPEIEIHFEEVRKINESKSVSFENVWLLFRPGSQLIRSMKGNRCGFRLKSITYEEALKGHMSRDARWCLDLLSIEWNGTYCGLTKTESYISDFKGSKPVQDLGVYPIEFDSDPEGTCRELIARGRKFTDLRGLHVMNYEGKGYTYVEGRFPFYEKKEVEKPVSGRVVIDAFAYYKCQHKVPPTLARIKAETIISTEEVKEEEKYQLPAKEERNEERQSFDDSELMIITPRVRGFDLKSKEWCLFDVDNVREPDWNEAAYEKLVLREGEKELVLAFADRVRSRKQKFDDFVAKKGEGIIILLCGPPGVGKTLTAEAVADKSKLPLYFLSAGDLGSTPSAIEAALDKALECCRLWDGILLLDEGDVFLEARGIDSLKRNELVTIFLRRLEYYQGLMFFTTNRVHAIDPAFRSRADLILPFPNLDKVARREVWSNFFSRLAPESFQIGDDDLEEVSKVELNGREIKNTVKTAQILADSEGCLTIKHLRLVLDIRKRCDEAENMEYRGNGSKTR